MLAPMNDNSYQDHVKAVRSACQTVAKNSIPNAAGEVKTFYEAEEDGVFNIAISGDGTWRRRSFSSSYGVVKAMSTVTGKALACEIMSKSAGCVYSGEEKKLYQNSRTGGRDISMNVQVSLDTLVQWMESVY